MDLIKRLSPKEKSFFIGVVIIIGSLLIVLFQHGLYTNKIVTPPNTTTPVEETEPRIVAINPSLDNEPTLPPNQTLEIVFNMPLENEPEFKVRLEPKANINVELSADGKIGRIIPNEPFALGGFYKLVIQSDTKFVGKKALGRDFEYKFKIVGYKGV